MHPHIADARRLVGLALFLGVLAPLSQAAAQDAPRPGARLLSRPISLTEAQAAGLPEPAALTWPRIYTLALVRSRTKPAKLVETFDPQVLAEQAGRIGFNDFPRFRQELLEGGSAGPFRDPSASVLALLALRMKVDSASSAIGSLEGLVSTLKDRISGEASGLSQLDLDQAETELQQARLTLTTRLRHYRDALDSARIELGLSPHAAVVLDRTALAGFDRVFQDAAAWGQGFEQRLGRLPELAMRLPAIGEVVVDGKPIPEATLTDAAALELQLADFARKAVADRAGGDPNGRAEAAIRRRFRRLNELAITYAIDRRRFVLNLRLKHQAFLYLTAPVSISTAMSDSMPGQSRVSLVIRADQELRDCQDRLVETWGSFQAERLALARDLGTFPYSDWSSFLASFVAREQTTTRRPAGPSPAPPAPPEPPIPAAPPPPRAR